MNFTEITLFLSCVGGPFVCYFIWLAAFALYQNHAILREIAQREAKQKLRAPSEFPSIYGKTTLYTQKETNLPEVQTKEGGLLSDFPDDNGYSDDYKYSDDYGEITIYKPNIDLYALALAAARVYIETKRPSNRNEF